jgi:tetratricopeptide (TPR) repeat protein
MASGGHGAAAFIHEARGEHAAAGAALAEIEAWSVEGEWPRLWASPMAALALARRGDFSAARERLDALLENGIYRGREIEVRCAVMAEERAWDGAGALVERARRHAEIGELVALPFHADRLEGRALLASGDAADAVPVLEQARAGFAGLSAGWEVALTDLSLGEALAGSGREEDASQVVARAAEVFERLGVPRELERARALLETLAPAR